MKTFPLLLSIIVLCTSVSAQDSDSGKLKKQTEDILALAKEVNTQEEADKLLAAVKPMILKDAKKWYSKVFGKNKGKALAKEYTDMTEDLNGLAGLFVSTAEKNRTDVTVSEITKAGQCTGLQDTALKAMKKPVTLYSVRMVEPGQKLGMHLWSFAKEGDVMRLVGKMSALSE